MTSGIHDVDAPEAEAVDAVSMPDVGTEDLTRADEAGQPRDEADVDESATEAAPADTAWSATPADDQVDAVVDAGDAWIPASDVISDATAPEADAEPADDAEPAVEDVAASAVPAWAAPVGPDDEATAAPAWGADATASEADGGWTADEPATAWAPTDAAADTAWTAEPDTGWAPTEAATDAAWAPTDTVADATWTTDDATATPPADAAWTTETDTAWAPADTVADATWTTDDTTATPPADAAWTSGESTLDEVPSAWTVPNTDDTAPASTDAWVSDAAGGGDQAVPVADASAGDAWQPGGQAAPDPWSTPSASETGTAWDAPDSGDVAWSSTTEDPASEPAAVPATTPAGADDDPLAAMVRRAVERVTDGDGQN